MTEQCCSNGKCCAKPEPTAQDLQNQVREFYTDVVMNKCQSGTGVSCCGCVPQQADKLAKELGYTVEELKMIPEGANMGLSCGNPAALAELKAGEVVLDLGSGGGFDVFVAGKKVGATGKAIGVDMTPQMLDKARRNQVVYNQSTGLSNVEFRLGEIEHLPIADNSVDVIISNCVLNLSTDKLQVWREIFRVLKPNGRVAVSDMALIKHLPEDVKIIAASYSACIGGAVLISETEKMLKEVGMTNIKLTQKSDYVKAMIKFDDPLYKEVVSQLPNNAKVEDFITSLEVQAIKPAK